MSYHRKSDFGVHYSDEPTLSRPKYGDSTADTASVASSSDSSHAQKYLRSASISVASEPTSTGLSFILDMDKEEAVEHSQSLHEDIEKMFDKSPSFTLGDLLSSGGENLMPDRGQEVTEVPVSHDRFTEDYDISSHRRASFPHAHVPLKSLHNHSLKSFNTIIEDEKKEKRRKKKKHKAKQPKKSKSSIFPSHTAAMSPAIPEVDKEEYSDSDESSNEDEADESSKLLDDADGAGRASEKIHHSKSEPTRQPEEAKPLLDVASMQVSASGSTVSDADDKPSLFYIGSESAVLDSQGSQGFDSLQVSAAPSQVSSSEVLSSVTDSTPIVILLNDEERPMVSTNAEPYLVSRQEDRSKVPRQEDKSKVKFLLGEEDEEMGEAKQEPEYSYPEEQEGHDDEEEEGMEGDREEELVWVKFEDEEYQKKLKQESQAPTNKIHRTDSKHKHHRHHQKSSENYRPADLQRRRQRGSDVQLSESAKGLPTETEEAMTLPSVDLDEMASHRMENLQGFRKHKVGRKKHKTVSSVVYIGSKSEKTRKKYFMKEPFKKTYDHSPHEVFVELDELFLNDEHQEIEWREKARWIKFEEDVEEGAERWGKPHVASLSFHSLIELRKGLEHGSLLLDLEAPDLITVIHRIVDNMVIHDQIPSDTRGHVMRTLLTKHKFVAGDGVKSLIRRNKSSMNLTGLDDRHQRDKLSIMKTLSSASFANVASTGNLQSLASQNHSIHSNQNSSNYLTPRSHSLPSDQNELKKEGTPLIERKAGKKEKKEKSNGKVGEPGRVEFVKVDIDNNKATQDGVHIGLVPQEADQKDTKTADQRTSLMRRIPRDAEACTVLVGHVEYLEKPAMAFVRLAEKQVLENLTEVPLPVRFVFVLLGPETDSMDYHEVGRSISTLMSNQHFHEIAYKAESRSEILHAINEFLNESIVLPPGDWDQKTLLPVMDMARKRAKQRRKKIKQQEELQALMQKEEKYKIPMDPLKRTGRLFGGLINDIRRRYPYYASDITDALNLQCIMALIFIFFACLAPCIAFGGLIGEKTYRQIGVTETIISTSFTNIVFALFSGQPVILYGATGPVLVFEKHLFSFCKASHIDFLTWRVWIGVWFLIITLIVVALEGSYIIRYFTRFTEEVFAILISLIFIFEVIHKLQQTYEDHPLREKLFYCDSYSASENSTTTLSPGNYTRSANSSARSTSSTVLNVTESVINSSSMKVTDSQVVEEATYEHGHGHYGKDVNVNEPNTALLSTILIFGTFLVAYFLRIFRNSTFLGRSARRALGDFGIFIAIVAMVLFDYVCADTFTQKLDIPLFFGHTDGTLRRWFVNPLGNKKKMEVWLMFIAIIPAFLFFLLLFLEQQLTQMLLHKKEFKLKKGTGFHLDQFILGFMVCFQSLFGLPWMCPATVRSVAHVSALSIMSQTHAPGEKPKLLEVKDQRVTNFVMNILIGTTLLWGPVLRAVPMAVLFGVFLYLGVSAISGVQLYKRIKLLFMPVKHHPGKSYVRRVRTFKMHFFTLIQVILIICLWIVKSTKAAIAFPLFVFLMAPLRLKLMPKVFTHEELEVLDKEEEDSDDEEDTDPDFYQMAHMPI